MPRQGRTGPHDQGQGTGRGQWRAGGSGKGDGFGFELDGNCICSICGFKVSHQLGIPCQEMNCPKCGGVMGREQVKGLHAES